MRIQVFRSKKNRQWYFRFRSRNGKITATSEGYKRLRSLVKTLRGLVLALNGPLTVDDGRGKPYPLYLSQGD